MMDESEYVIDKTIERAERELAKLKQLKSQVNSIADPKQANRNDSSKGNYISIEQQPL